MSFSTRLLADLDVSEAEFRDDPYPVYAHLRESTPIFQYAPTEWWVTSFDVAMQVVTSDLFTTRAPHDTKRPSGILFLLEPPEHQWLRELLAKALSHRLTVMRGRVADIAEEIVEGLARKTQFDLMADFAVPFPITVISELLGIPTDKLLGWRDYSSSITKMLDPHPDSTTTSGALRAGLKLFRLAKDLVENSESSLSTGLLSDILDQSKQDLRLDHQTIALILLMLLVAGHETTTNLIGNGLFALLSHPHQFGSLYSEPARIQRAVEELLRFDSPVQATRRFALASCKLADKRLRKGDSVVVVIGAANRDPGRFEAPNTLDIFRQDIAHLSFSYGDHACLGAQLGRYEAQCALRSVCSRLPDLQLSGRVTYREHFTMRGVLSLPVRHRLS